MKKIKILRIIARLNIGGPAIHAVLLTEGLNNNKFDSLLICGNVSLDEGDMSYYAMQKNIHPYFIPELKRELNFFDDLIALKKIYSLIKIEQPDIIHTHTAKAGALGRLAGIIYNFLHPSRNKQIKLIHTFHGHIFDGYFNKIKTRLFVFIERFLAFFSCKIITVSESVKNELILLRIAKERKIKVILLGLELDKFLSLPDREDIVLNVGIIGRLVPVKNHCLFLEAAAKVIRNNPEMKLRFRIIGDGELKAELEKYSHKLNIDMRVDFLGWQKDLVKIYSDLDIVALTSINEGTPVSLIEGMASGRPVIATNVGGVKDLLGKESAEYPELSKSFKVLERGISINSQDVTGFSDALIFLIKNKGIRQKIGICGREFAKEKFSKDRLIKDLEILYNNILI